MAGGRTEMELGREGRRVQRTDPSKAAGAGGGSQFIIMHDLVQVGKH